MPVQWFHSFVVRPVDINLMLVRLELVSWSQPCLLLHLNSLKYTVSFYLSNIKFLSQNTVSEIHVQFNYRECQLNIFQPLGFSADLPLFSLLGCIPWPKGTNGGGPSPLTVKRECLAKVCEKKNYNNFVVLFNSDL